MMGLWLGRFSYFGPSPVISKGEIFLNPARNDNMEGGTNGEVFSYCIEVSKESLSIPFMVRHVHQELFFLEG